MHGRFIHLGAGTLQYAADVSDHHDYLWAGLFGSERRIAVQSGGVQGIEYVVGD